MVSVPDNYKGGTPPRNAYLHRVQNMASLAVICLMGILVLGMVIAMVLREDTEDAGTDWETLFTPVYFVEGGGSASARQRHPGHDARGGPSFAPDSGADAG